MGPILRGEYDKMKHALEHEIPKDAKLIIEAEPYCNLQKRSVLKVFQLVINDPRFVFDDLFIARQFYFSAGQGRTIVIKHPKFMKILRAREHFIEYFYERYGPDANRTHLGMLQRYLQAENAIRYWNKQNRFRIVFLMYPALIRYIRRFKARPVADAGIY